jgi:hypothetical protein
LDSGSSAESIHTWSKTISGADYGDGLYTVKASSAYYNDSTSTLLFEQWNLFARPSTEPEGAMWASPHYDTTTGEWDTTLNSARFTLDGTYYGDWVSIALPEAIVLAKCSFLARVRDTNAADRAPKEFKIYGSSDGVSWTEIHSQTTTAYSGAFDTTFEVAETTAYAHIALVVSALAGGGGAGTDTLNFEKWDIYGFVPV